MATFHSDLAALKQPLAIRTDCITPHRTTLHVKQDRSWSNGDFTARNADGVIILSCDGKLWSNSARKEFKDASGLPLFSLRSSWFSMSKAWRVELPGDGHMIMAVRPRWSLGKVKLDCTFNNVVPGGEGQEVTLEVRRQDSQTLVTHIRRGESKVASVRRMFDDGGKGANWLFKPQYEVDVAEGMDMALVSYSYILVGEQGNDVRDVHSTDEYYRLQSLSLSWPVSFSQDGTLDPLRNEMSGRCESSPIRTRKSPAETYIYFVNWTAIVAIIMRLSCRNLYTSAKLTTVKAKTAPLKASNEGGGLASRSSRRG